MSKGDDGCLGKIGCFLCLLIFAPTFIGLLSGDELGAIIGIGVSGVVVYGLIGLAALIIGGIISIFRGR